MEPKHKHYKNFKEFLLYDLKLIRDFFEGHWHDSINCFEIPMAILVMPLSLPLSWRKFNLEF